MSDFLEKLEHLLQDTDSLSKSEVDEATQMMKQRRWELNLRREGACLICKSNIIKYEKPATPHIQKGDEWLDLLFGK